MPHPGTHPGGSVLTMVEHTVAVLSGRCAPVFVIAAERQRLPELDARVLRDEIEGAGPLVATGRGLRAAAAAGLNRAFVSAVDMPYLSVAIIEALAGCRDADIVLPWDGRDHYLAAIYRTALAEDIDTLITAGARSMRALTESVVTQRVVVPPGPALTNVNVESDLL